MKKFLGIMIIIFMTFGMTFDGTDAAERPYRIYNDPGGIITHHENKYRMMNRTGRKIEIHGYCASACTLLLAYIPRRNVCVGPKALLGFHQASVPVMGQWVRSEEGTRYLYGKYDASVRKWIDSKGGLKKNMIWLKGAELRKHISACRK
jgi:hypothetical protein